VLAAALAVGAIDRQALSDVTESWIAGAGGNWTTAADWSPSTNYPNNGTPAGTNYQASISLPGSSAYAVSVNSNIAVDSLTIGSSNATLSDTAGTLTVGGLTVSSGVFQLDGGMLSGGTTGATVTLNSPSEFDLIAGTLNDLTFAGSNLNFSQIGTTTITNGLNLSGNGLSLMSSSEGLVFDGPSQTIDDLSIDATGSGQSVLEIGGATSSGTVTLTLGANANLQGSLVLKNGNSNANGLLNNGTLNANINGQALSITAGSFTNNGIAEAANGGTLAISATSWTNAAGGTISAVGSTLTFGGTWNNAGTISAVSASTVNLGGSFSSTGLGSFTASADSTVNITGTVNNAGNTLALSGASGIVNLNGGTISGGTIAINGLNIASGVFDNATIQAGSYVNVSSGGTLSLADEWDNAGTINTSGSATLNFGGTFSLSDLGTLNLSPTTTMNLTGTLVMASSDVFNPSGYGAPFNAKGGTINGGTVAAGSTLNISSSLTFTGSWTNAGTITGTNVSLTLGGTFTPASIGTIDLANNGGLYYSEIFLTGAMTIGNGQTFTYNAANGVDMYLTTGIVSGGTISAGPSSTFVVAGGIVSNSVLTASSTGQIAITGGFLNDVTLGTGSIVPSVTTSLTILGGITGSGQTVNFISNAFQSVDFAGPSQQISDLTFGGGGYIIVGGPGSPSNVTLTVAANAGLAGGSNYFLIAEAGTGLSASLVNNGTIGASYTDTGLEVETTSFTNNNLVQASGGGNVTVAANSWTNAVGGTISASSQGKMTLGGTWNNQGTISASGGTLLIGGNWTNLGSMVVSSASTLEFTSNFTPASIGSLTVSSDSNVYVTGTVNLQGASLTPASYGGSWTLEPGAAITSGVLNLTGSSFAIGGGALNGVSVVGGTVTATRASFSILNGFTAAGNALNVVGSGLVFDGASQTVDNVVLNVSNYDVSDLLVGSSITIGGGDSTGPVTLTLGPNATLAGNVGVGQHFSGSTLINDGTMDASVSMEVSASNFINYGTLEATGTGEFVFPTSTNFTNYGAMILDTVTQSSNMASFYTSGTLNIGHGSLSGTGEIQGVLALSSASTLAFQINGTTQGTSYNYITVLDPASLAGDLGITVGSAFESSITPSETFTVLGDYGALSGTFANVASGERLETADGGGSFLVTYGPGAQHPSEVILSDFLSVAEPWTNATGNSIWDTGASANFNINLSPSVFHTGDVVTFNDSNNGGYNVTLNTVVTPGSVVVNNSSGDYTISGSGSIAGAGALFKFGTRTLTLSTPNTYTGGTNVSNGLLLIEPTGPTTSALPNGPLSISGGTLRLADNVTAGSAVGTSNVVLTSLSITGNGTLDIGNNRIIIDYTGPATDPIASIAQWIANGFYGLPGPSIISSDIATADAASGLSYGIGYADGADGLVTGLPSGEIEIMFTLLGDANLDGTVNAEDYTLFAEHLGQSGMYWDDGDFNYDGTVNAEDYTLFSQNIGQSAALAASAGPLEPANGISLTNIPEPMSAGLMVIAGLGFFRRRRRK
jgi:fibronectin-binding autotransporter adhesin